VLPLTTLRVAIVKGVMTVFVHGSRTVTVKVNWLVKVLPKYVDVFVKVTL